MRLATKTIDAINAALEADQGASYRGWLGKVIPHIEDAYRTDKFPFRSHLGASGVADECYRKPWYGFRWVKVPHFKGALLRLFNRGHLEEARFIALLLMIGVKVYQQDENGHQFRISGAGGHFGGSGDGVGVDIPDLPHGTVALLEFKTANDKKFKEFTSKGVKDANPVYFGQMQTYMRKMGLAVSLFMVVNKNNDDLHAELVEFEPVEADKNIAKGEGLVFLQQPPSRMHNASPAFFKCRWCDYRKVCFGLEEPHKTCRSCTYAIPHTDGKWYCTNPHNTNEPLTKEQQLEACSAYNAMDVR